MPPSAAAGDTGADRRDRGGRVRHAGRRGAGLVGAGRVGHGTGGRSGEPSDVGLQRHRTPADAGSSWAPRPPAATDTSGGWGSGATPAAAAAAAPRRRPSRPPPSVPAGWYADPAGRYELRYWDGSAWTEHVSRAGQQYTDPPVA